MAPTKTKAKARSAVLDLRAEVVDRPFMNLAGERYHFCTRADLDLTDIAKVQQLGKRLQSLGENAADMEPEQIEEIHHALRQSVRTVMYDMPDEVIEEELRDGECVAIVQAFAMAL